MSAMISESLSVTIQEEDSQKILLMSTQRWCVARLGKEFSQALLRQKRKLSKDFGNYLPKQKYLIETLKFTFTANG